MDDAETAGWLAPETESELREAYESVGPAAQTVVREVTKAMEFDRAEYDERVDGDVVETARDALFASLLRVRVADRETFEEWRERYDGAVHVSGSEHVDRVVWHVAPAVDAAVAATFQDERRAAVATLRRQAFGRLYDDLL
jgi:hypothetical protein